MDDIQYVGEHLIPGAIGRFSIILAFVASLVAVVAYFFAARNENTPQYNSWRRLGRIAFFIHGAAVFSTVGTLFYIISSHLNEYQYAWQHSSIDLPLRYVFSSFWEGQEGSFLLWTFWHVVLGGALVFAAGKWEPRVLAVIALIQAVLVSMVLGLYIGDIKIGSNPFLLLRQVMEAPVVFQNPNYLQFAKIQQGNGLNPLLQNYWMTIHPPTLFLGFALTAVPFAYAIAGLWSGDHKGWTKPALPWTLAAGAILGVGILMGGAWAYEALSFGGFWAWDPVENASLVPWLTLLGGLHTLLIYRHARNGLRSTYVLLTLTFLLVLYSTFLTRSGVLGDTSVHSFTDLGMSGQLLIFILIFLVTTLVAIIWRWRSIPTPKKEEKASSRELWMFIGSLVFFFGAAIVITLTSIPIYNKYIYVWLKGLYSLFMDTSGLAEEGNVVITNPIQKYNQYMWIVAVMIGVLMAIVQYLRYRAEPNQKSMKILLGALGISLVISGIAIFNNTIGELQYMLVLFAGVFAIIANLGYLLLIQVKKIRMMGGTIAHIGFGMMLVGILISNYSRQVLSVNNTTSFGENFSPEDTRENKLLAKGEAVQIGDYMATYLGYEKKPQDKIEYEVYYVKMAENGDTLDQFYLYPNTQMGTNGQPFANPDTKHFFARDIYTHIGYATALDEEQNTTDAKADTFDTQKVALKDTFFMQSGWGLVESITTQPVNENYKPQEGDLTLGLNIRVQDLQGNEFVAQPVYLVRNNQAILVEDEVKALGITLRVEKIFTETDEFLLGVKSKPAEENFIIMRVLEFPWINVLWLGIVIMAAGFFISVGNRIYENRRKGGKHAAA